MESDLDFSEFSFYENSSSHGPDGIQVGGWVVIAVLVFLVISCCCCCCCCLNSRRERDGTATTCLIRPTPPPPPTGIAVAQRTTVFTDENGDVVGARVQRATALY